MKYGLSVLARELAQVRRPRRVGEARPVAGLAVGLVELGAALDSLRRERLRRGARAR